MRNMKRLMALVVVFLFVGMVTATASASIAASITDIKLFLNGNQLDKEIIVVDGSSYLPVRAISEALGLTVGWNGDTRTITLDGSGQDGTDALADEMLDLMSQQNRELTEEVSELKDLLIKNNIQVPTDEEVVILLGNRDNRSSDEGRLTFVNSESFTNTNSMYPFYPDYERQDTLGNIYENGLIFQFFDTKGSRFTEYPAQGQYNYFKGTTAIGVNSNIKGVLYGITFKVYADDVLVYEQVLEDNALPTDFNIDIRGAKIVKIEASGGAGVLLLSEARFTN